MVRFMACNQRKHPTRHSSIRSGPRWGDPTWKVGGLGPKLQTSIRSSGIQWASDWVVLTEAWWRDVWNHRSFLEILVSFKSFSARALKRRQVMGMSVKKRKPYGLWPSGKIVTYLINSHHLFAIHIFLVVSFSFRHSHVINGSDWVHLRRSVACSQAAVILEEPLQALQG